MPKFGRMWRNDRFHVPHLLVERLRERLVAIGYYEAACASEKPGGQAGGASAEETYAYFAKVGLMACVRPLSVMLDPRGYHETPRTILHSCVHQGNLLVIDVPSGPGTTGLSLVAAVYEMRRNHSWFPHDLTVDILAIDISPHALAEYNAIANSLRTELCSQNITLNLETACVDLAEQERLAAIVNDWVGSRETAADHILVLSAAMTALGKASAGKEAVSSALSYLTRRLQTRRRQARYHIWIETNADDSNRLYNFVRRTLARLRSGSPAGASNYAFWHAFQNAERHCRVQCQYQIIAQPPGTDSLDGLPRW